MCRATDFEVLDAVGKIATDSGSANIPVDVAGGSIAFVAQRGSHDLYQAARAHRALVIGSMVMSAARTVATHARRAYTRHVQRERARAASEALRTLDDRTLRDLGFHRSELDSTSPEWMKAMDATADASVDESASPTAARVGRRSPGGGLGRFPSPAAITPRHREEMRVRAYRTSTPRFAFGLAAAAMTAITLGVMVVAPAIIEAGDHGTGTLAASRIVPAMLRGAVATSAIAVIAFHQPWLAMAEARHMKPAGRRKPN